MTYSLHRIDSYGYTCRIQRFEIWYFIFIIITTIGNIVCIVFVIPIIILGYQLVSSIDWISSSTSFCLSIFFSCSPYLCSILLRYQNFQFILLPFITLAPVSHQMSALFLLLNPAWYIITFALRIIAKILLTTTPFTWGVPGVVTRFYSHAQTYTPDPNIRFLLLSIPIYFTFLLYEPADHEICCSVNQ